MTEMPSTDNFSKNLRFLRENSGRTQEQLAEVLGVKRLNITAWESGRTTPNKFGTIRMISDLFDVSCDELLFGDIKSKQRKVADSSNIQTITVYGKVCAGDGLEAFDDPIDEIVNPYHRAKKELFALQVHGDSMNNIVNDGMYAIVEKADIVNNGDIAVVLIDGDVGMLKKFYQLDESMVVLKPDSTNPIHKAVIFENEDINRLKIIGKYIGHVSPMIEN